MSAHLHFAIVGARGTTGQELQALLAHHPEVAEVSLHSARPQPIDHALAPRSELQPGAPLPVNFATLGAADGVFLCTPHGASAQLADSILASGGRVVDLSGDLRLKDPALHRNVYGGDAHEELRARAVYGLHEWHRDEITNDTRLVSNPGCYPTAVSLALKPLLDAGRLDAQQPVIADCKSGMSGAGATPSPSTHFGNVHENFRAYGVGTHRHAPEIAQETGIALTFVPHLLPVWRGILATIYLPKSHTLTAASAHETIRDRYREEAFVHVLDPDEVPDLRQVQHTNDASIGVSNAGDHVVVIAAIDNLIKGAAGQAIQNMNAMCGIPHAAGLPCRQPTKQEASL